MWGVLQQGISTLDVDFVAYADEHFDRLLANAARPRSSTRCATTAARAASVAVGLPAVGGRAVARDEGPGVVLLVQDQARTPCVAGAGGTRCSRGRAEAAQRRPAGADDELADTPRAVLVPPGSCGAKRS